MTVVRKIVEIDEELCDGCGVCVPACAEGAIVMIDGKAKLVGDILCDGLGACLGDCPLGAITVIEREAVGFDAAEVERHLKTIGRSPDDHQRRMAEIEHEHSHGENAATPCGCPGSALQSFDPVENLPAQPTPFGSSQKSCLRNWPLQLKLVPPVAPFLKNADLLICADCVPFAYADFHRDYVQGKIVLVGCPKLDDIQFYLDKMKAIFIEAQPSSITVLKMEVPCCNGIATAAIDARDQAAPHIPVNVHTIGVQGDLIRENTSPGS